MNQHKCPACGRKFPQTEDTCPVCKVSLYPPKVFAGPNHALILLGSGDLYAIGHNESGACGEGLPEYLEAPVCIAKHVKHAAASPYHTAYVTTDGEVRLIGHSDLTERFHCDLRAKRIFAGTDQDTFIAEAESGVFYLFGYNGSGFVDSTQQILKELSPLREETTQRYIGYSHTSKTYGTSELISYSKSYDLEDVRNESWYRELLRVHGERNIAVLRNGQVSETLLNRIGPKDGEADGTIKTIEKIYQPVVVLTNKMIYHPVPCNEQKLTVKYTNGGLPLRKHSILYDGLIQSKADMSKVSRGYLAYQANVGCLYADGTFGIGEDHSYEPYFEFKFPTRSGVLDFALSSGHKGGDYILLVDRLHRVFKGSKKLLIETGNWDHLEQLSFPS